MNKLEQGYREKQIQMENEAHSFLLSKAKAVVPEVRPEPYVKIPFMCKIGLHDSIILSNEGAIFVEMCSKCGDVLVIGSYGQTSHTYGMGYGDPNLSLHIEQINKRSS